MIIDKKYDARYWYKIWRKKGHVAKPLVSSFVKFDAHKIIKMNKNNFPFSLVFSNDKIKISKINITKENIEVFPVKYESYKLKIESTACYFGGERYWVNCPNCKKRMKILYIVEGFILCRNCLNAAYYSQRIDSSDRCLHMRGKFEDKLKKRGGDGYNKPHYMHKKTYQRLNAKIIEYEFKAEEHINRMFGIFY